MTHPIDDDDVARLVREVASGWVMPPTRLDDRTWHDRVRGRGRIRLDAARRLFGRVGQAAGAALALTLAGAVVAVYLTSPAATPGSSGHASPSAGSSRPGSSAVAASPLPRLRLLGDLPSPSQVIVLREDGEYAVADLGTGVLAPPFTATSRDGAVRHAANGDLVCVCSSEDGLQYGQPTHAKIELVRYDGGFAVTSRSVVLDITGNPDPRDGEVPFEPDHLSVATTFSPDGAFAFVGWSARTHPDWTSGIVVVRLEDGTVVDRLSLPKRSDGTGDGRTQVDAPRVVGADGTRVVIDRPAVSWSPAAAANFHATSGSDVFVATFSPESGALADAQSLLGAAGCGDEVKLAGPLPAGGIWLSCVRDDGSVLTTIRRLDARGSEIGETPVYGANVEGATSAVSPDGSELFLWDPVALTLHRVDLATGAEVKATAPAASAGTANPLAALGRWLAPAVEAKAFLLPGIAISPDGSRVYALGVVGDPAAVDFSGSAGVAVFDAATMQPVARWSPTADFVSIAVSPDGHFVYAAGAPGVSPDGRQSGQPASITVFDASTGATRLIAGDLGGAMLSFPSASLP